MWGVCEASEQWVNKNSTADSPVQLIACLQTLTQLLVLSLSRSLTDPDGHYADDDSAEELESSQRQPFDLLSLSLSQVI